MTTQTQDFLAYISKHSISRSNRFQVIIPLPQVLADDSKLSEQDKKKTFFGSDVIKLVSTFLGGNQEITRGLNLMVEQTELPGKNLSTTDVKYNGDFYKHPYSIIYGAQPITFNISKDMYEKNIIDEWMNLCISPYTLEVSYMDDYVVDIIVNQLDNADRVVHSVVMKDAYPMSTNPLVVSNTETNVGHKLLTIFAYRRWEPVKVKPEHGVSLLSQTPLGPYITPILSNPAVQRALQVLEDTTGIDLEGEAVNIYNQIDGVVRNTTGSSINKGVTILENIKASLGLNDKITSTQAAQLIDLIDRAIKQMR